MKVEVKCVVYYKKESLNLTKVRLQRVLDIIITRDLLCQIFKRETLKLTLTFRPIPLMNASFALLAARRSLT